MDTQKIAKKVARKLADWKTSYNSKEVFVEKTVGNDTVKVSQNKAWINGKLVATSKGVMHETEYKKKLVPLLHNEIEYAMVHIAKHFY